MKKQQRLKLTQCTNTLMQNLTGNIYVPFIASFSFSFVSNKYRGLSGQNGIVKTCSADGATHRPTDRGGRHIASIYHQRRRNVSSIAYASYWVNIYYHGVVVRQKKPLRDRPSTYHQCVKMCRISHKRQYTCVGRRIAS